MSEHKYPRRFKPRGVLTPGFVYAEVSEPGGALIAHCANGTSHQWGNSDTEAEAEHRMQVYENWHNCETFDHEATAQLSPPDTLAAAEIEATWRLIENEYDIEPRAQIEAEAKTNGFKYGLAQAIHTIWKRDPKVADLAAAAEEANQIVYLIAAYVEADGRLTYASELRRAAGLIAAAIEKRGR